MPTKKKVNATFSADGVLTEKSDAARTFYDKGRFGIVLDDKSIHLSFLEALYLLEKKVISIFDGRNQEMTIDRFIKRVKKTEPNFGTRFSVFKDMRNRGYIVKTALKFGADFRVYDRGIKPGEDHARWVIYPVKEGSGLTWHDFAAKNRVAHSTKKRLMIGVVDDEGDVTYYEIRWKRP